MIVRYRFLERTDKENNRMATGIAYSGFFSPELGPASYCSLKCIKDRDLGIPVDKLEAIDILNYVSTEYRHELGPVQTIHVPDEDDEWTPDDLLYERNIELEHESAPLHRKTA